MKKAFYSVVFLSLLGIAMSVSSDPIITNPDGSTCTHEENVEGPYGLVGKWNCTLDGEEFPAYGPIYPYITPE